METLHLQSNGTKEMAPVVNHSVQEKHWNLVTSRQMMKEFIPVWRIIRLRRLQPLFFFKLVSKMLQNKKIFFSFKVLFARTRLAYEQTEHGNAVTNMLTIGGSDQDLVASECVACVHVSLVCGHLPFGIIRL